MLLRPIALTFLLGRASSTALVLGATTRTSLLNRARVCAVTSACKGAHRWRARGHAMRRIRNARLLIAPRPRRAEKDRSTSYAKESGPRPPTSLKRCHSPIAAILAHILRGAVGHLSVKRRRVALHGRIHVSAARVAPVVRGVRAGLSAGAR